MMDKVFVTVGDRAPFLRKTLFDATGPIDLTGVVGVKFNMIPIDGGAAKVSLGTCTIVQTGTDPNIVDKGVVEYPWAAIDLDTAGIFLGEFQVNYAGSISATFPSGPDKIYIVISPQLG